MLAVPEDGADFRVRQFEGETGVVLEKDALRRPVIVEHAFADDVQQDGPVVDVIDDIDIALHQPGFVPDGLGQFFPGSGTGVEDAHPAHAGHPEFPVSGVAQVIDDVGSRIGGGEGEIVGIVAVQDRSAVGGYPQEVSFLDGIWMAEGVEVADDRPETVLVRVVLEQRGGIAHQELAVPGFPKVVGVRPAGGGHVSELSFGRETGYPAVRRGPDGSVRTAKDVVHLVVGKAQRIIRTEVLVILVDAVSIEPAGGGDPDVTVRILGEGVHPLVGEPVGHDDGPGRLGNGRSAASAARKGEQEGEKGQTLVFHRFRFG